LKTRVRFDCPLEFLSLLAALGLPAAVVAGERLRIDAELEFIAHRLAGGIAGLTLRHALFDFPDKLILVGAVRAGAEFLSGLVCHGYARKRSNGILSGLWAWVGDDF